MAQRVGRVIALLFHDRGTRRGWVVSSTPRPHFTPKKDPVPILQEAGWAPGPVWTGGKSRPHRDSIPDRPARSLSLYWLIYPAHGNAVVTILPFRTAAMSVTRVVGNYCGVLEETKQFHTKFGWNLPLTQYGSFFVLLNIIFCCNSDYVRRTVKLHGILKLLHYRPRQTLRVAGGWSSLNVNDV